MEEPRSTSFLGFTIKPISLTGGIWVFMYATAFCFFIHRLMGSDEAGFAFSLFPPLVVGGLMNEAGISILNRPLTLNRLLTALVIVWCGSVGLFAISWMVLNLLGLGQP